MNDYKLQYLWLEICDDIKSPMENLNIACINNIIYMININKINSLIDGYVITHSISLHQLVIFMIASQMVATGIHIFSYQYISSLRSK